MNYVTDYSQERIDLDNGYMVVIESKELVFITEAEASKKDGLLALLAEIKDLLPILYPDKQVSVFVDPYNTKLFELFMKRKEFEIDYVSFKMKTINTTTPEREAS